jgi:hypothetical protein
VDGEDAGTCLAHRLDDRNVGIGERLRPGSARGRAGASLGSRTLTRGRHHRRPGGIHAQLSGRRGLQVDRLAPPAKADLDCATERMRAET